MSVHFIVQMKQSYVGPRYDEIQGLKAEIQVRTILMDAWANVSHYLDYKGESSIPTELRRDFYALSGLFFIADKHFELFFRDKLQSRKRAMATIETDHPNLQQELNLETFQAYLQRRLPDRRRSEPENISRLVEELSRAGYTSLDQVDRDLDAAREAFEKFEEERPPKDAPNYAEVGTVRASIAIANPNFGSAREWPKRYEPYRGMVKKDPSEKAQRPK